MDSLVTDAVSFVVKDLLNLDEELKAIIGTKKKMEKLKELSTIIDKAIQDIESRPSIEDAVKDLLKKLKYLAYDLEDVVDYYDTKILQKKQRSESTSLRPVRDFFSSDNQVVFKHRVGGMIKDITESLDSILLQKSILLNLPQSSIRMSEPSLHRETHSSISFVVIGREPEKDMIVDMLTNDDDDDNENNHGTVKVIAIVGMGGLGKTTLAQHVFNDERVKAHFENSRMWTVVGAGFDPAKIMKSILEAATNAPVNISEMDSVRKNIEKALSGKRFLLVLDDVWNEDQSKWGILKAPLTFGARGSRILVTTRSQHVSSIMGSSNTTHQIQVLSENECLSLFKQFAFGDEEVDPSLMEIGGKIVKKCGGVPLAAISLGNMLHSTRDATYWSSVLKSEIWQLRDQQKQLFAILKLSYDSLPPQSKKCFAFASLFSKNYPMPKDKLIKLWIANGFVHSEGNFDAETIGNRVFKVFSELKFLRALDLSCNDIREVPLSIGNLIHLRYLNLSSNNIEVLPDSITLLSNLRYLNLNFNDKLRELPKELGNMQNLRDLDLQYNPHLTHMPCGLSRLTNLRSLGLFVVGDKTGTCSIIELEDLKLHGGMTIQFSKDFINYSCGGRKILKNKDLNELCIEFNGSKRYDKDMLDALCPNTSLKKLTIFDYGSSQFPTWLIELQLPNLVEVSLKHCCGWEHIPPFGNLQFLKKLDLHSIFGITQMGDEFHGRGGFPALQKLFLNRLFDLEEWSEPHGVDELFPELQLLQVCDCFKLKSMPKLPRIQHLEISCCSGSLLSCIGRLTSLSVLKVNNLFNLTSLPSGCIKNLTSLTTLQITNCRNLQSLPRDEMQHLAMLRSLTIERCDNLDFFPFEVGSLGSLRSLYLAECPSMIVQPEILVQILNSVHTFRMEIWRNEVNLSGQLQYLRTLKKLSLCGGRGVNIYQSEELSICCCEELESLMTIEAASSTVQEELSIDEFSNLTTLPDWLQHLKSLSSLEIRNCPLLERVPRDLKNLHMLKTLTIVRCPQLESRYEIQIGEDWPIISHVQNVYIS